MKAKLARIFSVIVVVAMLLSIAPTAVLARPPKPVSDGQTELQAPDKGQTSAQALALKLQARNARQEPGEPNPVAAAKLASNEARLLSTGKSPRATGQGLEGEARLLVIPVEFAGTDTLVAYPDSEDCSITETVVITGPMHNLMPNPAGTGDNFSIWTADFDQEYYRNLFFGVGPTAGVGVIRTDMNDGKGVDLSGLTAANYFLEQSQGRYRLVGEVLPWIQLPHSEGYYGYNNCGGDDMTSGTIVADALAQVLARGLVKDWTQYDADHDGVVDHLMVIHAGTDESAGGGPEGPFAIWAHSSHIRGNGYEVDPVNHIRAWNYTIVPENTDVGVIVHEYGHDIGLPDLYSNDSLGSSNSTGFWDLMSSGSWNGRLGGSEPSSMGLWDRMMLGWADPVVMDVNSAEQVLTIGQIEGKPANTQDGVIVRLPNQVQVLATAPSATHMWWSNNNRSMTDNRIWRAFDLTSLTGEIMFTAKASWSIEEDWDFAFLEVSADGGATWAQLPEVNGYTTPADYADPYGNMATFGNMKYGITGESEDWVDLAFDLSAYAGQNIRLRWRYMTDEATVLQGLFIDDMALTSPAGTAWSDNVEKGASGWAKDDVSRDGKTPSSGFVITDGVFMFPHYYLIEWRNNAGFDRSLAYVYQHYYSAVGVDIVNRLPYSVPGALLWYRNFRYNSNMDLGSTLYDSPSYGPKGSLLVVDSHAYPTLKWPTVTGSPNSGRSTNGRLQTADSAFGLNPTLGFDLTASDWSGGADEMGQLYTGRVPSRAAVSEFHDSIGYFPGLVLANDGKNYWYKFDCSVVLPATADYWPRWAGIGSSGNPGTSGYGVNFQVVDQAKDGTWGKIRVYNSGDTFLSYRFVDKPFAKKGETVTVSIVLKDSAGTRYEDDARYNYTVNLADAIPAGCSYVANSVTGGGQYSNDNPHPGPSTGTITWQGQIGGNFLDEPDAVITYKVKVDRDTNVGRAMTFDGLVTVVGAGATGYTPEKGSYTLTSTVTVAPESFSLPMIFKK